MGNIAGALQADSEPERGQRQEMDEELINRMQALFTQEEQKPIPGRNPQQQENMSGNGSGGSPQMELEAAAQTAVAGSEPDSLMAEFSKDIESEFAAAEQRLDSSEFSTVAAQSFLQSLRTKVTKHRSLGCRHDEMEVIIMQRAVQTMTLLKNGTNFDIYQTLVYLCCSVGVYSKTLWLTRGPDKNLHWDFSSPSEGLGFFFLVKSVIGAIAIIRDQEGPVKPEKYLSHLRQLLDVVALLERDVTNVAVFILMEGFATATGIALAATGRRAAKLINRTASLQVKTLFNESLIAQTWCLIRLGFVDIAEGIGKDHLHRVDRSCLAPRVVSRLDYVQAVLLKEGGNYKAAIDRAERALSQTENAKDRQDILKLLQELTATAASEESINPSVSDQPAEEWIEDCNIHQIENQAERQEETWQKHQKKSRHRRPHRRSPKPEERVPLLTSGTGGKKRAAGAERNASLPRSQSSSRSRASSSPGNRSSGIVSDVSRVHSNSRSSDNSRDSGLRDWEEDSDDDVVNDYLAQDIPLHDDYYVNDNDKDAVPLESLEDQGDDEQDWFEKSEAVCNNYEDINVDEEEVFISESQIADLQRGGEGREFYPTLTDKEEILNLLKINPERYKRCQLKIEWSHKSIAKVLDKGSKYSEILIVGRSKAGQCYMDDEVVVEIVAEPGKSRGLHNAVSRLQGEDVSLEKMAHGKVIGLLKRVTFQNVEYPVLFCTLDELEGHLMRPLCKTVPKIHVMNDTVRRKYPALLKNRVEIKEIVDGRIQYKGFCDVKPEQREQYVFRVVLLSWRQRNIYPLGAVLGCTLSGRDYSGGLKVLSMQQRVPKLFPRSALEDTKKLLEQSVSRANRQDLTEKRIFTIDPPGSKDLDDAVSIDVKNEHFIIGVHIADVAAVVKKDSGLDQEARRRAVTFYPQDRKPHPMLPEPLSHGRCSLLFKQERPAFSVFFTFNQEGEQTADPVVKRTVIKSCAQLTYEEVQKVIDRNIARIDIEKAIQSDILLMHSITSKLREKRQKKSMLFVPFDDPRLVDMDHVADHMDAHSLIEELMILTNCYMAKRLIRTHRYHDLMIIRCHKSPTFEELQDWQEKGGSTTNLVMKLQGRKVTPEMTLSVDNFRPEDASPYQHQDIIVQKGVWEQLQRYLEDGEMDQARRLAFSDTLHPLQCLAANRWMDLMETAQYKCSYGLNRPDLYHFGLDEEVYTHFTSPIRRYADIHVQRLLHADLDGRSANCTADEVTELCQHINSATARQKAFGKGCRSLKVAESLQKQSLIFRAYVSKVDTEQLTLCVPSLLSLSDRKQELTFSVLGVGSQPELVTDTALRQDKVTVQWTRRVYDKAGFCPGRLASMWRYIDGHGARRSNSPVEMSLCPHQLTVSVRQADWADILKTLIPGNRNVLENVPLPIDHNGPEVDYMTSEKGDNTVCLRPVRYKREYKEGQVIRLQMSALPSKGVLKPRVEMLQLARNVCTCTQHVSDPVLALTRHATRATKDQNFSNFSDYRKAWMPLLEMEAASGAGDSDGGAIIDNVKINIKTQESAAGVLYKGVFHLPVSFCFDRCLQLGGKAAESIREEEEGRGEHAFPVDYLCLRYEERCEETVVSRVRESSMPEAVDTHYMWLAHASVVDVAHKGRKAEGGGSLVVTFVLSPSSPPPPQSLLAKDGDRLTLEILPKAPVDRRAQEMLLLLDSDDTEDLAKAIAFGRSIPKLDKEHKRLGQKDENHEVIIPDSKRLPINNPPQLEAIQMAMTHSLTMIQGPPGSGKTNTGIKLVYLFCQVNRKLESEGKPRKTVLYCGPSNKSVDLVARELRSKLGVDLCPKIVRVYGSAIESKDYPVPRGDLNITRGMRDLKSDPNLQDISLHHIIRQSGKANAEEIATFERLFERCRTDPANNTVTNEQLKKYRKLLFDASTEELKHYEVVLCTCAVGGNMRLIKGLENSVYQLIIDECAMSPEPQSMVPIVATGARQVVLIGDHKQLRPIIKCQPAAELGLDQSLFERLYQKYPAYTVFLSTQYRMHPDICAFPSKEFYEGKLQTGYSSMWGGHLLTLWPRHPLVPDKLVPHVIVDVKGEEETLTVSTEEGNERSKSNSLEAEKVIEILTYLKKWHKVDIAKVKILTQYNAQRHLLEQRLRTVVEQNVDGVFEHYDKNKVNSIVSTVVSSQGGEWDYVILSTVRSLPSYLIEPNPTLGWCRQNLGFITDRNQVNVALTRARRGLVIVGNVELLRCDDVWRHLVERYERLGCSFSGEPDSPSPFPPPPPRSHHRRRRQAQQEVQDWQN